MTTRKPLYFTFGNHMHWVDMQWLWGHEVLPSSIRDMLALCEATGARGNVNFDGVGYEKLAAEDPGALSELRAALHDGRVEVAGASYGQPYGLFHGGESNVRQRIHGVRACLRLLGVRPRSFWEEEFDFFPQLPQILAGCGYTGASLFFQWTWHTPTLPEERVPLVIWEGVDGTRLPAVAKTELCLHQWPEDFDGRLESPLVSELDRPAVVQWLELLPSPDWMCRSEVLLPRLKELFGDPRFDVRPRTLGELILELGPSDAPVRAYGMDDVFHGVTLGKNADHMVRRSLRCEERLLAAESLSALLGYFGRPYASWDVYPTWELEEAWRELLAAQHHDNHECEGLCGAIGETSFDRSATLSREVLGRDMMLLAERVPAREDELVVFNPCGWSRDVYAGGLVAREVPPYGFAVVGDEDEVDDAVELERERRVFRLSRGSFSVEVDRRSGRVSVAGVELGLPTATVGGETETFPEVDVEDELDPDTGGCCVHVRGVGDGGELDLRLSIALDADALELSLGWRWFERPDGGMHAGLHLEIPFPAGFRRIVADTPYALGEVRAERDHVRKYPSGDWMTSEQWFETIRRPFTAHSLVDLQGDEDGLLILHDGSQSWFRTEEGVHVLLDASDPWDGNRQRAGGRAELCLLPHGPMADAERWRLARERVMQPLALSAGGGPGDLPRSFGALELEGADNVAVTAFHRESTKSAEHLPERFAPRVRNPYVVRLVELEGRPADVTLRLPGAIAAAARTNLLGELVEPLAPSACPAANGPPELGWSAVSLSLRPREIATVMLDLELGRHVPRNLDEHRHVWATVHRKGTEP